MDKRLSAEGLIKWTHHEPQFAFLDSLLGRTALVVEPDDGSESGAVRFVTMNPTH